LSRLAFLAGGLRFVGGGSIEEEEEEEEEITEEVENKKYVKRGKGGQQGVTVDMRERERERKKFSRREEWKK
jgi:hypothetical protein